jgi:pyrroline-5-carboxylate reductase
MDFFVSNSNCRKKIIKDLRFRPNQTIISFISTITLSQLKRAIKVKAKIVRAIPLPPISLKKGPVPICPPNRRVKNFFNKLGTTVEIKNEKSSINFWSTSGMMAPFYELLRIMTNWLVRRGVKRDNAQKYITSLFLALSEDAVVNSKRDLKFLVKDSQTPKGLNEQGVRELTKLRFYKSLEKTLNSIHKRLSK